MKKPTKFKSMTLSPMPWNILTSDCFHKKSFFFLSEFSFTDTNNLQDWVEGRVLYSSLPLPSTHEHSDIYLQLCIWDDCHVFLIASLVITRLLLHEICHLGVLSFDNWWWNVNFCLFSCWGNSRFFITAISHRKAVDLNAHRLSPWYYPTITLVFIWLEC